MLISEQEKSGKVGDVKTSDAKLFLCVNPTSIAYTKLHKICTIYYIDRTDKQGNQSVKISL